MKFVNFNEQKPSQRGDYFVILKGAKTKRVYYWDGAEWRNPDSVRAGGRELNGGFCFDKWMGQREYFEVESWVSEE